MLALCKQHDTPCRETDLSLNDVYNADEMFCTGTMGELVPVTKVDDQPIGNESAGPMTKRLTELFRALVEREDDRVC